MRTIDNIMSWFYLQEDLIRLITINVPENLIEDATQEIVFIILEYDRDKIKTLWKNNELKWFIIRIITNQLKSATSPFFKNYIKPYRYNVEFEEKHEDSYQIDLDNIIDEEKRYKKKMDLLKEVNIYLDEKQQLSTQDYHDTRLFKLYNHNKLSFRGIQKLTGVHYVSAHLAVKRVQKEIDELFNSEYIKTKDIK